MMSLYILKFRIIEGTVFCHFHHVLDLNYNVSTAPLKNETFKEILHF